MSASHFCNHLSDAHKVQVFDHRIGVVMLTLGLLYFLMSVVIIYFIKIQEYYARTGNDDAVRAVIFPTFVNVLWANAAVNVYVGCIALVFTFNPFSSDNNEATYSFATMYALQHLGTVLNTRVLVGVILTSSSSITVTEGVALLLMQKGLGVFAAKRAMVQASVWAVVTVGFQILIFKNGVDRSFAASIAWQSLLAIFYGCLWLAPQRRLFRRPAVIYYARTWFLFRLLCMAASVLFYFRATHSAGSCLYVLGNLFPYAIFEPLLMYYTLLQDSKWWQGQDIFQGRRDKGNEEIRSPLQGIDLNLKSAQSLAASMDQMGHLSPSAAATLQSSSHSPHRQTALAGPDAEQPRPRTQSTSGELSPHGHGSSAGGAVRLLNFAYISLDKNKQLGSGSFSRVYQGQYRGTPCAVKLIFTVDLTVDVIKRVAAEAQLLSLIRHPNVVDILGVAVLPPSVCILLELCSYGSLGDAVRNNAAVTAAMCAFSPVTEASNEVCDSSASVSAQAMRCFVNGFNSVVSYERTVHGGAEGGFSSRSERSSSHVSALLSVSTGNASTSFNLTGALGGNTAGATSAPQVTLQQIQALSLSWSDRLYLASGCARGLAALHTFSDDLCHRDIKSFNFLIDSQLNAKISDLELGMAELLNTSNGRKHRKNRPSSGTNASGAESVGNASDLQDSEHSAPAVACNDILANWSAPEVIQGGAYTQAADVYGFALVLWEILVGRVPFSEVKRQDDIRRRVTAGVRPLIPACFTSGEHAAVFAPYVSLIQRGWDADPQQRPSVLTILSELEDMLHNTLKPLFSTSDASLHLSQQLAARTASVVAEDLAAAMSPGGGPDDGRASHAPPGRSFSIGSPAWWHTSFAPRPGMPGGSGFSSPGAEGYMSPAQQVLENLRCEDGGAALQALEGSGGCYVIVMPLPPHEVVWATHSWCLMSGCDVSDIVGKPLSSLPIFDSSSFVRIKSGSQRKGTLAAELEAPRHTLADVWTACMAVLFGASHASAAAAENARATSLFFKSLNSRYLHRARSVHAVVSVLDFSSRAWNMSASQRTVHTLSRRLVSAVTGRPARGSMLSADSGATAPGMAGSTAIDHSAQVICSAFSVRAYPVYQRTVVSSPVPISAPNGNTRMAKAKSGFFGVGSLSKQR
jgi:serine/threonine protein kinase